MTLPLLLLAALYPAMVAVTRVAAAVLVDAPATAPTRLVDGRAPLFMACFALFFAPLLYGLCRVLARRPLGLGAATSVLYAGTTTVCAMAAEIIVNRAFVAALGRPAWEYHVLPIHRGDTSLAGLLMWPMYGWFVAMLHRATDLNPALAALRSRVGRALLVGADAMVLEIAANLFSLGAFGTWYFFYLRDDLRHFTSGEIFLPYVAVGALGLGLLERLKQSTRPVMTGALMYAAAVVLAWMGL